METPFNARCIYMSVYPGYTQPTDGNESAASNEINEQSSNYAM